jgi:hypothetical protein
MLAHENPENCAPRTARTFIPGRCVQSKRPGNNPGLFTHGTENAAPINDVILPHARSLTSHHFGGHRDRRTEGEDGGCFPHTRGAAARQFAIRERTVVIRPEPTSRFPTALTLTAVLHSLAPQNAFPVAALTIVTFPTVNGRSQPLDF